MENVGRISGAAQSIRLSSGCPPATRLAIRPLQSPLAPSLTLDSQLCFALYTASLAMTKAYKAALERFDLTYPQYLAMLVLWEHDELSVKDLAARLGLDSATLTPILKRLETVGYVRRVRGVLDERLVLIHLTDNGRALKLSAASFPTIFRKLSGAPFRIFSVCGTNCTISRLLSRAACECRVIPPAD